MSHSETSVSPDAGQSVSAEMYQYLELSTQQKFYDKCTGADWSYMYSESHSVYRAGADAVFALRLEAERLGHGCPEIFAGFNAWSHDSGPRPERP